MRVVTSNYPMTQESPQVLSVSEGTGIEESALAEVVLYPNPATETLFFKGGVSGDIYFNVYNMYGQTVKKGLTSLTNGLNVSDLTSGVYYIEITSEKQTSVLRFIKE